MAVFIREGIKGPSNQDARLIKPEAKNIKFEEADVIIMHEYKL